MTRDIPIKRVLLYRDQGLCLAQALELDLCAQGESFGDAIYYLGKVVAGQIAAAIENDLDPFRVVAPPPEYAARFDGAIALTAKIERWTVDGWGSFNWPPECRVV